MLAMLLFTVSRLPVAVARRIGPRVEHGLIRRRRHPVADNGRMADTDIVMYARPGCPFCTMLRADLAAAGLSYRERNIWQDPAAAAAVRAAANGNETVPTINIGDVWMVNPSVEEIQQVLRAAA
jgi:mycoredoxin